MVIKIEDLNLIKKELLSPDNYDASFDCSDEDDMGLNEFYHEEALDFHKEKLGRTYVFHYNKNIIGFVTLAMTNIRREKLPNDQQLEIRLREYPALLIGRLATHNECRGQGVGTYLLNWSLGAAISLSDSVGCRYVVLQTRKSKAKWYQGRKRGMKLLEINEHNNRPNDWWFFKRIDIET